MKPPKDNELENFQIKALKVIQMNYLLDQGNERLAMSDQFTNWYQDLREAITDKPLGRHPANNLLIDWNGIGWDIQCDKEET